MYRNNTFKVVIDCMIYIDDMQQRSTLFIYFSNEIDICNYSCNLSQCFKSKCFFFFSKTFVFYFWLIEWNLNSDQVDFFLLIKCVAYVNYTIKEKQSNTFKNHRVPSKTTYFTFLTIKTLRFIFCLEVFRHILT